MKKSFSNYLRVFIFTYTTMFLTKILFIFYLQNHFIDYPVITQIGAALWGYKFDFVISSIIALMSSFVDYNKKIYSILIATLITWLFFMQVADILYFDEASRHISYEVKDSIVDAYSLFMTAYTQHTFFTIGSLLMGGILFTLLFLFFRNTSVIKLTKGYFFSKIILIIITIFFVRGMFQLVPLTPWHANQIGDSKLASISLTASYNIMHALINEHHKLQNLSYRPILFFPILY